MPFPHTNPVTDYSDPQYTATYVTPRTECRYCHGTPLRFQNNTTTAAKARSEWAKSGKGDVTNPAWKNSPTHDWKTTGTFNATPATSVAQDCVRCHVAKGFTQYVGSNYTNISPVGVSSDKTSEPLTCNACHNTDSTTDPGFTIRAASNVTAYYNYSSLATKKLIVKFDQFYGINYVTGEQLNNGGSNLCIACHSGRESGATLWKANDAGLNFNNVAFINSHYMTAAGSLYQSTGFEYYTSPSDPYNYQLTGGADYHQQIGTNPAFVVGGDNGPCAGCHMSTTAPHSYQPVLYSGGQISNISFCQNAACHDGRQPSFMQLQKDNFNAALEALRYLLENSSKHIYYNGLVYPYFFNAPLSSNTPPPEEIAAKRYTTWGNVQTMGAAFNYNLLKREAGAWAHNPVYTKRLLWDSIDWIDDYNLNQSTGSTIINLWVVEHQPFGQGAYNYLDNARQ
jgi:hypothetical protein